MFDFGAIGNVAETLTTATRDIDSRLESIETMMRVQTLIVASEEIRRIAHALEHDVMPSDDRARLEFARDELRTIVDGLNHVRDLPTIDPRDGGRNDR